MRLRRGDDASAQEVRVRGEYVANETSAADMRRSVVMTGIVAIAGAAGLQDDVAPCIMVAGVAGGESLIVMMM